MEIPKNIEVIELPTTIIWFNEDGICCTVSKKHSPQSLDEIKKYVEDFKKILNGRKVCLLLDITNNTPSNKEVRDYISVEMPKLVKAIALVSKSALGKMIANLFFNFKPQPYPTKMFSDEAAAKEWLKQYL